MLLGAWLRWLSAAGAGGLSQGHLTCTDGVGEAGAECPAHLCRSSHFLHTV